MLAFRGCQKLHILEFALNSTQKSIFLSMSILSTIVQKGADCKSKVLPPCVLDIIGQNSRGTNKFSSVKHLVRFLKLKVGDQASRKAYTITEAYPLERSSSLMSTPKKLRIPEAHLIEELDQDGARLSSFCVVLF